MPYEVYVNHPNDKAYIHDANCRFLRQHGGVSRANPPTGRYSGVIEDLDDAWQIALAANKAETRTCTVCLGNIKPGDSFG